MKKTPSKNKSIKIKNKVMNQKIKSNFILVILGITIGCLILFLFQNNNNTKTINEIKQTMKRTEIILEANDSLFIELFLLTEEHQQKLETINNDVQNINEEYQKNFQNYNWWYTKKLKELKSKVDSLKVLYPNIPIID